MDNRTLEKLRAILRKRSNGYMFEDREDLNKYEEAVLDGRIEEIEEIIAIIDLELLGNPDPETLLKKRPK